MARRTFPKQPETPQPDSGKPHDTELPPVFSGAMDSPDKDDTARLLRLAVENKDFVFKPLASNEPPNMEGGAAPPASGNSRIVQNVVAVDGVHVVAPEVREREVEIVQEVPALAPVSAPPGAGPPHGVSDAAKKPTPVSAPPGAGPPHGVSDAAKKTQRVEGEGVTWNWLVSEVLAAVSASLAQSERQQQQPQEMLESGSSAKYMAKCLDLEKQGKWKKFSCDARGDITVERSVKTRTAKANHVWKRFFDARKHVVNKVLPHWSR